MTKWSRPEPIDRALIEWHLANGRAMQAEAIRHGFYRLLHPLRRHWPAVSLRSAASPSG